MLRVLPGPSVRDADLVQDLYIKELKAYKAPEAVRSPHPILRIRAQNLTVPTFHLAPPCSRWSPPDPLPFGSATQSKSASLSAVKSFSPPTPPQAPASLSTSLAADLQTYESTAVDLAPKEAKVGKSGEEVVAEMTLDDLFEEMKADLPKHTSAH